MITLQNCNWSRWLLHNQIFARLSIFQKNSLRKQQKLDPDLKGIQEINFTENLTRGGGERMYFIVEEEKETILDFSKGTAKVLCFYFGLIKY